MASDARVTQDSRWSNRSVAPALNRVQRLNDDGCDIVRRHWVQQSVAQSLGADRLAEVAAQRIAAVRGLAPPVIAVDLQAGWMSMPFVAGARLESQWWQHESRVAAVLELLTVLRELPAAPLPVVHLADRAVRLHRELETIAPGLARRWDASLQGCFEEWQREPALALEALECFVHGDLSTDNLLGTPEGGLVLLDFEYAHRGHRLEDLAGLVVSGAVPTDQWRDWLSAQDRPLFETLLRTRTLLDGLWTDLAMTLTGNAAAARAH
jgi:aminoglycoside phosphotransferase (APT) family kinase protein